jgi:opacity protein-like surface antigen
MLMIQNWPINHVHAGYKIYAFFHDDRNGNSSKPWSSERFFVPKFKQDAWNHIVVRIDDSDNCYLTMNGESIALQSSNRDLPGGVYIDSFIGGVDGGSGVKPGVRGDMDDIRIYNRALSDAEVAALYELEKPETVILPKITAISENTVADEGETIELTVVADGEGPLLYSWKKIGSNAELSKTSNLVLKNIDEDDAGNYYVVISNQVGEASSPEITIVVRPDTDNDGLLDHVEIGIGTDITKADTDGDGLSDYEEYKTYKTNPISADSDGDGLPDGVEIAEGFDPLVGTEASDGELSIRTAVELEFFTLKSQSYQLQWSTDLSNWNNDGSPFKGVGGFSSILRFAREDGEYWRLKVVE